jgi:two-component system response regulator PhoP
MMHVGEVKSKSMLIEHIYDQDFDLDSNVIEVFIRRLRKKLDPDGQIGPIETLRGQGYKLKLLGEASL